MKWYRKAAEQNHTEAQISLGSMYEEGRGVPRNETEAAFWYSKAAGQGESNAEFARSLLEKLKHAGKQFYVLVCTFAWVHRGLRAAPHREVPSAVSGGWMRARHRSQKVFTFGPLGTMFRRIHCGQIGPMFQPLHSMSSCLDQIVETNEAQVEALLRVHATSRTVTVCRLPWRSLSAWPSVGK